MAATAAAIAILFIQVSPVSATGQDALHQMPESICSFRARAVRRFVTSLPFARHGLERIDMHSFGAAESQPTASMRTL
ncbi:MAG: hypothetical protein B7Z83_10630 [Thiomonas sp. 20-64-5]|nr:MAG: hypothetical protein B7Z83_10630 [Thiomonas sp. 20-64-5]